MRKPSHRKNLVQYDLGLPEFKVIDKIEKSGDYLFIVEPVNDSRPRRCEDCGHDNIIIHKNIELRVNDLDINNHRVGILIQTKRYRCKHCGSTFTPEYASIDGRMTKRLRDEIRKESFRESFSALADRYGVSSPTILNIFNEQAKAYERDYVLTMPEVLGLDEVHLHSAYRGVFVDVNKENGKVIELTETRSKEHIKTVLKKMAKPENLKYVTMDMWQPYKDAVLEVFPGMTIIIDRFHVIKELQKCLETIRKAVSKAMQNSKIRKSLKNNRFLMLASSENLSPAQSERLDEIFRDFPEFQQPYELKEAFRNIYELATSVEEAEAMYAEWCKAVETAGATEFQPLIDTIANWHTEIFNYFKFEGDNRTNAQTESLNRIIKDMDRMGRGYTFPALRAKIIFGKMVPKRQKFSFNKFRQSADE